MAGMFDKVMKFARSPQGQRVFRQASSRAQRMARDPKTRTRVDGLRRKITGGGKTPPEAS